MLSPGVGVAVRGVVGPPPDGDSEKNGLLPASLYNRDGCWVTTLLKRLMDNDVGLNLCRYGMLKPKFTLLRCWPRCALIDALLPVPLMFDSEYETLPDRP